jgi:hypothetical protein
MKTKTLIFMSIFLLAVTFLFAEDVKKEISDEDFMEAWSGTWINTDYGRSRPQKLIYYPDGRWETFVRVPNTLHDNWGKDIILDKWLDSEGNIWYRAHWESSYFTSKGYAMGKISNSGNTLEVIWASESFPIEEWEPDRFEYTYQIHYRQ